jgi:uncharacterized protein YbjT (DUF2867 family)
MSDDREELHVVFGTGPVGLSVMDELVKSGAQVRLVNQSGKADVPAGVEVRGGDASKRPLLKRPARERRSSTTR